MNMKIIEITTHKKEHLSLLLLADEQENMIDKYINCGRMFALDDNGIKAICIVTNEGNGILEIKNIAVEPKFQHHGYGKAMIEFLTNKFSDTFHTILVGTGNSPLTIPFYEKCGFEFAYRIKNFFIDNYDHPIIECDEQLTDMIYLKKQI